MQQLLLRAELRECRRDEPAGRAAGEERGNREHGVAAAVASAVVVRQSHCRLATTGCPAQVVLPLDIVGVQRLTHGRLLRVRHRQRRQRQRHQQAHCLPCHSVSLYSCAAATTRSSSVRVWVLRTRHRRTTCSRGTRSPSESHSVATHPRRRPVRPLVLVSIVARNVRSRMCGREKSLHRLQLDS